mgnify:CR=1 FL=1
MIMFCSVFCFWTFFFNKVQVFKKKRILSWWFSFYKVKSTQKYNLKFIREISPVWTFCSPIFKIRYYFGIPMNRESKYGFGVFVSCHLLMNILTIERPIYFTLAFTGFKYIRSMLSLRRIYTTWKVSILLTDQEKNPSLLNH